ncbi:MAG: biopolymer transporter ExbD [Dysgonamonadaceae bacterium]|jgi:biopolymer transport protein ExbD|nr:biopolymer transporter ExbD [Dysgonamonadaceae bacterium]
MNRFRKTEARTVPGLNTSSLPDLIFTLLLFFLLVINMRTVPVIAQFQLPEASELQKLKENSLLVYIIAGQKDSEDAEIPLQLNNRLIEMKNLQQELQALRAQVPAQDRDKMLVILKIDRRTDMGFVSDIRKALRQTGLLTVYYSAEKIDK